MSLFMTFIAPFHLQIAMGESRPQNMLTHSPTSRKACWTPATSFPPCRRCNFTWYGIA